MSMYKNKIKIINVHNTGEMNNLDHKKKKQMHEWRVQINSLVRDGDVYYKNALEMMFTIKNALEMMFTVKMHWK